MNCELEIWSRVITGFCITGELGLTEFCWTKTDYTCKVHINQFSNLTERINIIKKKMSMQQEVISF